MTLREIISAILKEQQLSKNKFIPVDIILTNGHILLRSFRIYELDNKNQKIKGLTYQEKYIHSREQREPAYCTIGLEEIKELHCPFLELKFSQDKKSSLFESN